MAPQVGTLATSPDQADDRAELGFDTMLVGTDAGAFARGFEQSPSRYR